MAADADGRVEGRARALDLAARAGPVRAKGHAAPRPRDGRSAARGGRSRGGTRTRRGVSAQASRPTASRSRSTSPIAGRITVARAALGAYVEPDTELFRVADPRFVVIEAAVPRSTRAGSRSATRAEITTGSGASCAPSCRSVTPTVNAQTRSATVTLSLAPDQRLPAPGEFVQARIATRSADANGFVVPDEAVQTVDGRNVVFVRSDDEFRVTPVVVAARSGGAHRSSRA